MNADINRYYDCSAKANFLHPVSQASPSFEGKSLLARHSGRLATIIATALLCLTFASVGDAFASKRIALLMAGENYDHLRASAISSAKIEQLGGTLRSRGFAVTYLANPNNATARAALREFAGKAAAADFALVVASGHMATYRRKSFYLPVNSRVRRATDLFSRGLSVTSIADIARRAKFGALILLTTVPDIPSTIAGISVRPDLTEQSPPNLVTVFSTSTKVPVTSIDRVSVRAASNLAIAARQKPLTLAKLIDGASAGGAGLVFGKAPKLDLSKDQPKPSPPKPPEASNAAAAATAAAAAAKREAENLAKARLEAERQAKAKSASEQRARELAEQRLRLAEERARRAELRARQAEAKAKREREAQRQRAAALAARQSANSTTAEKPAASLQSLQVVEALLGRAQRRTIQRRLQALGFYNGPLDAVFGERTRDAIKAFQRRIGAADTGYLTPDQLQQIVAKR